MAIKSTTINPATTQRRMRVLLVILVLVMSLSKKEGFLTAAEAFAVIGFSPPVAGSLKATFWGAAPPSGGTETALPMEPGTGAAALRGAFSSSSTGSGGLGPSGTAMAVVSSKTFALAEGFDWNI